MFSFVLKMLQFILETYLAFPVGSRPLDSKVDLKEINAAVHLACAHTTLLSNSVFIWEWLIRGRSAHVLWLESRYKS